MFRIWRTTTRSKRAVPEFGHIRRILQPSPCRQFRTPCPVRFCSANTVRTFDTMLSARRAEARRSILVQVSSERSYNELYHYCAQFGTIESSHHYRVDGDADGDCHYILLEFSSAAQATAAMQSGVFSTERPGVRARSIFMWFRTGPKPKLIAREEPKRPLALVAGTNAIEEAELNGLLSSAESIDDQITILHRLTKLNDLGKRLRFLAVRQLESSLQGMFPQAVAHPFGSSVNGYGRMGCDLDVILDLDSRSGEPPDRNSRLVYHTKATNPNERTQVQRQLESIGDVLQLFLPGVNSVRRILKARVPIVKYHHEHLDLEIDLTMNNTAGVYMSELLYLFGQLDARVRPLTFCVRRWAQSVGLTNQTPGYWITNFSLTMLVMYFLQQLPRPVLPSINRLIQLSVASSQRQSIVTPVTRFGEGEAEWAYTFLKNPSIYGAFRSENESSLEQLLMEFFEFYSQFDFNQRAISLNLGSTILKPDHSPMYIVNPLETVLNVSKNVNLEEMELFRMQVRNAVWLLEANGKESSPASPPTASTEPWGLVSLFGPKQQQRITPQMFFTKRMVNVKDIFDDVPVDESPSTTTTTQYRNTAVKNQFAAIQRAAKTEIHKLSTGGGPRTETRPTSTTLEGTGVKLKRTTKRR